MLRLQLYTRINAVPIVKINPIVLHETDFILHSIPCNSGAMAIKDKPGKDISKSAITPQEEAGDM